MFQNILDAKKSNIYWIASYPRSGNTFTRILMSNYFLSKDIPYPINKLRAFIPSDTSAELWETLLPGLWQDSDDQQKWQGRHPLIAACRGWGQQRPFPAIKTHTANLSMFDQPAFKFLPGDRVIYIVRHPLDLLLSYADYNGRDIDKSIEIITNSGLYLNTGQPGGIELRGSWREHVVSWITCKDCPVLLVRYEDLCENTEVIFRDMLNFLGVRVEEEKLHKAVRFSHFASLQQQEAANGFTERPATALSGRFFREGRSRQWLTTLSPEQACRLADNCGEIMTKLGYTHPRDVYLDGRNAYGPVRL